MAATASRRETYLPDEHESLARVYDLLQAHEAAARGLPEARYFLSGTFSGDRVELPAQDQAFDDARVGGWDALVGTN